MNSFYLVSFLIAFWVTYVGTPWVKALAIRWNIVDLPDARKVHGSPTPRGGGVAVFAGITAGILLTYWLSGKIPGTLASRFPPNELYGIAGACFLMLLLGIADDVRRVPAKTKLVVQILAGLWAVAFGVRITFIGSPFTHHFFYLSTVWSVLLTTAWMVGITNALNLLDGLDGLLPGTSTISSVALFLVAFQKGYFFPAIVLAGMCGSTLAFLRYNFYPAKIFLGDAGSLFLGMLWAAISVAGPLKTPTVAVFVPLLILGIPIADTLFAIFRRFGRRKPIFEPDKEHLHHRLLDLGWSHKQAVVALYFLNGILGVLALLVDRLWK